MKYSIQFLELGDFYRNQYLKKENKLPFSCSVDMIKADPFQMWINEWKSDKFKAQRIQIESSKDIEVIGGMPDNMFALHFVSKGNANLVYGSRHANEMDRNTNNVYAGLNKKVKHTFYSNRQYEYFKVFLSFDFVYSISMQNPEVFAPLISSIERQQPLILHKNSCLTTMDMQMVIDQITNCHTMGNIAPFYFDNKVQELLLLQLQQKSCQLCHNRHNYEHYKTQVNEARRIIEEQYQNPPTISALAISVGMSATLLKTSFKMIFGTTIYGYLFDYRMNIARKLLMDKSYAISEIAEHSGYEHASHFTTAFKRKFGISPMAYRKKVA